MLVSLVFQLFLYLEKKFPRNLEKIFTRRGALSAPAFPHILQSPYGLTDYVDRSITILAFGKHISAVSLK